MNAIVKAQYWIINNRAVTAKLLSSEFRGYLPVSEKVLLRVFEGYEVEKYGNDNIPKAIRHPEWNIERIGFQPYPYPSATRFIFDQMKHTLVEGENKFLNKHDTGFIVKDLVDSTFVKNAIKNLGGTENFSIINKNNPWEREEIIDI